MENYIVGFSYVEGINNSFKDEKKSEKNNPLNTNQKKWKEEEWNLGLFLFIFYLKIIFK